MAVEYAADLYVHAIAIEREAAERYAEFAARMDKEGNVAVAALFRMLSTLEARHLDELKRRTADLKLPPLTADYSWLDSEAPETAARIADDPGVPVLAQEMAAEEAEHVVLIERMLLCMPAGEANWRCVLG